MCSVTNVTKSTAQGQDGFFAAGKRELPQGHTQQNTEQPLSGGKSGLRESLFETGPVALTGWLLGALRFALPESVFWSFIHSRF